MVDTENSRYQSFPEDSSHLTRSELVGRRKNFSYYSQRYFRPSVILLLLIWGSYLLIGAINRFGLERQDQGGDNDLSDEYELPNSLVNADGSLKVSFDNVRNNTFKAEFHSLQWIRDDIEAAGSDLGLYMTLIDGKYLIKSVYDDEYSKILFEGNCFEYNGLSYKIDAIIASSNLKNLIIKTNTVSHWRHSTIASYFEYEIATQKINLIGDNVSFVEWSPNSLEIAYVQYNDIYIHSIVENKTIIRVTDDGNSQVFNGKPDWVYEEEVLESDKALWWSKNGSYLTFMKFDDTAVNEYTIPYFVQESSEEIVSPYPEMRSIKYPKSGTSNPVVDLWVFNRNEQSSYPVKINSVINKSNGNVNRDSILITEVEWIGDTHIIAKTTDRSSEVLKVLLIDALKQETKVTRTDSSNGGWWEITHNTLYISRDDSKNRTSEGYIDLYPIDGYNHLVYFSPVTLEKPLVLTRGKWEVVDGAISFDPKTNDVYFIATKKSSVERHLYKVNLNDPENVIAITNTKESGVYSASFSSGSRFVLLSYLGPDIPYQKIIDLNASKNDSKKDLEGNLLGKTLYYLEKNTKLKEAMRLYSVPQKSFQNLNLGIDEQGNEIIVNSFEILPDNFDADKKDYYPVFFYAYGGPNSQQVIKTFSVGFNEVVASQLDAIVVVVDGRGTGFKGKEFRSIVRDNLGDVEAQDQIAAAKLYREKSYVNAEKISLFGWSYGGYLTLKTLEKDAGKHIKYGISVAPVTDWRFYDSVYTERYMHTPQENDSGYQKAKIANVTAISQSERFLLMHGTGDDNVHFQNSMKFLDMIDLNNVENYDVHIFPDSDHSIRYHNANNMVYNRLLRWVKLAYTGQFTKTLK